MCYETLDLGVMGYNRNVDRSWVKGRLEKGEKTEMREMEWTDRERDRKTERRTELINGYSVFYLGRFVSKCNCQVMDK
jgi:hypothetical protein